MIPPYAEAQAILHHAIEWTGWYHACVHGPTFRRETEEFWSLGENRTNVVNPAWLAVFFAQLSCGVKHMTKQQLSVLGTCGLSDGA